MRIHTWIGTITLVFGDYHRSRVGKYTATIMDDDRAMSPEEGVKITMAQAERAGFDSRKLVDTVISHGRKQPRAVMA